MLHIDLSWPLTKFLIYIETKSFARYNSIHCFLQQNSLATKKKKEERKERKEEEKEGGKERGKKGGREAGEKRVSGTA